MLTRRTVFLIKLDAAETAEMLEAFRMVTIDGNSERVNINGISCVVNSELFSRRRT
jgi:hypothetical protein